MISTRSVWLAAALLLGGCGGSAPERPPMERARVALAQGDGLGAEIALRQALHGGAARRQLAAYFAEAELLQGNLNDARGWLAKDEFTPATAALGFRMKGRLALADGDLAAAGRLFDRALRSDPDDAELWVDIARLRYRGGEQEQAVAAGRKALALEPGNPRALLFDAQIVRDSQGTAAGLRAFERALDAAPGDPQLLAEYAATLGDAGRARDSLAAIRRLAEADPRHPAILFLQAVIAARGGNYDLARSLLLRGGERYGDIPAAILLSGVIDLQNGNYATAAQAFDRLSRLQPDNARARALLARSLASGGNALELAHRFDQAANTPYLATLVGRAHEKLGERDKAAAYLDRASRTLSGRPTPLPPATSLDVARSRGAGQGTDALALVRGLLAAGQPAAARIQAQEFYRRFPGSSDAMGLAGDAAMAAGDPRAALQLYARASRIRRPWPLVRRMAAAHVALGDFAGTDRLLADYLEGDPQNGEAAALLARSAYMRGEYARSARLLDHALALGGARDPVLHALRSELAMQQGDQRLAGAQARRAYALQPSNPAAARMRWATAGQGAALARK